MSTHALQGCALDLTPATLSAWRDGALPASEARRVNAHIATCDACQARLAEYEKLARGLAAIRVPEPVGGYGRNPRMRRQPHTTDQRLRRPVIGGLGALAAVALLALAFTTVLHGFGNRASTTAMATVAPVVPTCQASQLVFGLGTTRTMGGHEGVAFAWRNLSATPCSMNGYVTARATTSSGINVQHATSAPTFVTTGPHAVTLHPLTVSSGGNDPSNTAYFYLDWPTRTSTGATCADTTISLTAPGASQLARAPFPLTSVCGPILVSPVVDMLSKASRPATAAGLPTCQVSQLMLAQLENAVVSGVFTSFQQITNESPSACQLTGFPSLQLLDVNGNPLTGVQLTTDQSTIPQAQPLGPGDTADFTFAYNTSTSNSACITPTDVLVALPGTQGALENAQNVDALQPICGTVTVSALTATSSADVNPAPTVAPAGTGIAAAPCQTSTLSITGTSKGVASGHISYVYTLTNSGSSACTLEGYPTLQLLDAQGQPIPTQENETTTSYTFQAQSPQVLTLVPGPSAYFYVGVTNHPSGNQPCVMNAASMRVTPPGNTASLQATPVAESCGATDVSPVQAKMPGS